MDRQAVLQPEFIEDLRFWVEAKRKLALRALAIVQAVLRDPCTGNGKPEALNYSLPELTWVLLRPPPSRQSTDFLL